MFDQWNNFPSEAQYLFPEHSAISVILLDKTLFRLFGLQRNSQTFWFVYAQSGLFLKTFALQIEHTFLKNIQTTLHLSVDG